MLEQSAPNAWIFPLFPLRFRLKCCDGIWHQGSYLSKQPDSFLSPQAELLKVMGQTEWCLLSPPPPPFWQPSEFERTQEHIFPLDLLRDLLTSFAGPCKGLVHWVVWPIMFIAHIHAYLNAWIHGLRTTQWYHASSSSLPQSNLKAIFIFGINTSSAFPLDFAKSNWLSTVYLLSILVCHFCSTLLYSCKDVL